ncbi:PorP/SprF family type IX secretion system membrane protein [Nafulsella turpanensis]|uniref:PorP/SprF family type IX secretion system membrane protein n=1 Tax=Nafulsella turpanensis TaxID=1265690 RepID=UPI000345F574|nr:PorP/SprF family type IX secretion system membrane protein [Nafulsella turpanensis]
MKKIFILIFMGCFLLNSGLFAQEPQEYRLSQYFLQPHAINPAFSGIENFWKINAGYRQQWTGMEESPEAYFLSFNGLFKKQDVRMNSVRISRPGAYEEQETDEAYRLRMQKHGFGGFLSRNDYRALNITSGFLSYAYHMPLSRKLTMALGVAGGLTHNGYNANDYHVRTTEDVIYQALLSGGINQTYYGLKIGGTLYGRKFYAGYTASQLIVGSSSTDDVLSNPTTYVHHYAMVGYQLNLSRQLVLQPSILVRYDKVKDARFDANVKLRFDDLMWAGVSYRNKEAIAGMFGLILSNQVTLGYAYEQNTGEFNIQNNGTHEVVLGLRLNSRNRATPYFW